MSENSNEDAPQIQDGVVDPTGRAQETDEEKASQQPAALLGEGNGASVEPTGPSGAGGQGEQGEQGEQLQGELDDTDGESEQGEQLQDGQDGGDDMPPAYSNG